MERPTRRLAREPQIVKLGTALSLHAAEPKTLRLPNGGTMRSAVRKAELTGPQPIGPDGLPGDGSQERMHHLPEMALHAYSRDRYPEFERRADRPIARPAFGENLSLEGATEDDVCVGDIMRLGTARLEVSQPTIRCAKLGRNQNLPDFLAWIEETGYCGYYLRVLEPGKTAPGDSLILEDRPHHAWTITRLHRAMFEGTDDATEITALPPLGPCWSAALKKRR